MARDGIDLGDGPGALAELAIRRGGEAQGIPVVGPRRDLQAKTHAAVLALVPLGRVHVEAEVHLVEAAQHAVHIVHGLVDLLDGGLVVEQLADGAFALVDAVGEHLHVLRGSLEALGQLADIAHDALQLGAVLLQDGVEVLAHGLELLGQLGQLVAQVGADGLDIGHGVVDGPVVLLGHGAELGGQHADVVHDLVELLPALLAADGFVQGLGDALHILADLGEGLHEVVQAYAGLAGQGHAFGEGAHRAVAGVEVDELLAQDADGAQGHAGVAVDLNLIAEADGHAGLAVLKGDGAHIAHLHAGDAHGALEAQSGHGVEDGETLGLVALAADLQLLGPEDEHSQQEDGAREEEADFGFELHGWASWVLRLGGGGS